MKTSKVCFHCRWSLFWQYHGGFAISSRNRGCVWWISSSKMALSSPCSLHHKLLWASKMLISIAFKGARGYINSPINHNMPWHTKQALSLDQQNLKKIHQGIFILFQCMWTVVDIPVDSDSAVVEAKRSHACLRLIVSWAFRGTNEKSMSSALREDAFNGFPVDLATRRSCHVWSRWQCHADQSLPCFSLPKYFWAYTGWIRMPWF